MINLGRRSFALKTAALGLLVALCTGLAACSPTTTEDNTDTYLRPVEPDDFESPEDVYDYSAPDTAGDETADPWLRYMDEDAQRPDLDPWLNEPGGTGSQATGWRTWRNAQVGYEGWVCGPVASIAVTEDATFLNLGAPYPEPDRLTIVMWNIAEDRFSAGDQVCGMGTVETYRGSRQVQVDLKISVRPKRLLN